MIPVSRKAACVLVAALFLLAAPLAQGSGPIVRTYDAGIVKVPDPSEKGALPARFWGVIGVPDGPGPHPLVLIAHGRHGDNCPHDRDFNYEWPCWAREQRNDLGMRHIVKALAAHGIAAIAPDLNGAYTIGWGKSDDRRRWPRIVRRTLDMVTKAASGGQNPFGVPLYGRIAPGRLGLLAHSRSGDNAVRFARSGRYPVASLLLLAPIYTHVRLPDVPTTVVLAECDGDVHGQGRGYLTDAEAQRSRKSDVFQLTLERANHNYFNSTLAQIHADDGPFGYGRHCRKSERLKPPAQQHWIDTVASEYFASTLDKSRRPRWMKPPADTIRAVAGLATKVRQLLP